MIGAMRTYLPEIYQHLDVARYAKECGDQDSALEAAKQAELFLKATIAYLEEQVSLPKEMARQEFNDTLIRLMKHDDKYYFERLVQTAGKLSEWVLVHPLVPELGDALYIKAGIARKSNA